MEIKSFRKRTKRYTCSRYCTILITTTILYFYDSYLKYFFLNLLDICRLFVVT